jgi:predicted ATP-grasp superfamily ATP-dependent carboligase
VAEGAAMLRSLAADFTAIEGVRVDVLRDRRYRGTRWPGCTIHSIGSAAEEAAALRALAPISDCSVVIAPEFGGHLLARCRAIERAGGKLLGPASRVVALAADKHATAEHLAVRGVSAPEGIALSGGHPLPENFKYPAVLKPRDGAGSQGIQLIGGPAGGVDCRSDAPTEGGWRLEEYREGVPASVACLCGPGEIVALAPCRQRLGGGGHFQYLGGSLPLDAPLAERAARLAVRAIATLDGPLGYLGVDLILGDDPSGGDDVAIEINPRLTTSYVGLRALARGNLAAAMLAIAAGRPATLSWRRRFIQFEAAGRVRARPLPGGV